MYISNYALLELDDFLVALSMSSCVVGVSYMMLVLIYARHEISKISEKLTEIYNKSEE